MNIISGIGKDNSERWAGPGSNLRTKIPGDGSKVFALDGQSIQAGVHGRKQTRTSNGTTFKYGSKRMEQDHLGILDGNRRGFVDHSPRNGIRPAWIQDTITRNFIFRLPERRMKPSTDTQWDVRYLVVGYPSGGGDYVFRIFVPSVGMRMLQHE